ncbi:zinc finger CCCH domain-containing protein C337.12 [Fopius arisanus]|uniref:Zinc finger CCCH domain-containing protein C337.12 n=1 Tax=Fopius arisanus TaxID=64838 RepID=A0A9R1T6N2_9HYME|nr:PREDICTED: zinc finger CCCH domain-containing protein C337.12 [Fopius arisanus]
MQASNKPSTIYVNPMFKEAPKNVIHINPKVHINMAIHVNPRMINTLTHDAMQQGMIENTFSRARDQKFQNVQKSVHVNPRLMEKLTSRIPDVEIIEEIRNDERVKLQPQTQSSGGIMDKRKAEVSVFKPASPDLVSLSRRKLVRIRPENQKLPQRNCGSSILKSLGKGQILRVSRGKQLKKVNSTNHLRKVSPLKGVDFSSQLKKINREARSLKKVTQKSSTSRGSQNKYKIDRTGTDKIKTTVARETLGSKNKNLINIDGVFYRSSKSQLVKSSNSSSSPKIQKKSPVSPQSRKIRTHVVINGKIAKINPSTFRTSSLQNPSQKSNYKHVISNRVKQRSLQILRHKMCKNNQPCLLFQRFGYCAKHIEGTCPKVHDKKQVALCKNFLQGKCLLDNCPLSHDVGPEKMPTCKYFLEGCCTRDNCQYLHVKVSANTPICVPFLRGYCAKGDQCKERHTSICPEFDKYGKCAKGKNCPYPHKSCLLPQQNTLRLPKSLNSYNKQKSLKKSVDISSHGDSKKRYYDESCSTEDLERKKCNINNKIRVMAMMHKASEDIITEDIEMKSQPIAEEIRPRRSPIGTLPSYIPIN